MARHLIRAYLTGRQASQRPVWLLAGRGFLSSKAADPDVTALSISRKTDAQDCDQLTLLPDSCAWLRYLVNVIERKKRKNLPVERLITIFP